MSNKRLLMNRFAECILSDYENFSFKVKEIKKHFSDDKVHELTFDWEWNGYSGFGYINFTENGVDIDNVQCRDSSMTVGSNSRRQQENGRHTCSLYNDHLMQELFEKMIIEYGESLKEEKAK